MKNEEISASIASSFTIPTSGSNNCTVFGSPKQLTASIYDCYLYFYFKMQKPCPEECQCNDRRPFTSDSTTRPLNFLANPFNHGSVTFHSPPTLAQLNDCEAHSCNASQGVTIKAFSPHFFVSSPSPPSSLRISSSHNCHDLSSLTVYREGGPRLERWDSFDTLPFPFCRPPLPLPFSCMDTLHVHDYDKRDGSFIRRRAAAPSRTGARMVAVVRDGHHSTACIACASPEVKSPSPLDPSSSLCMEESHCHCLSRSGTSSASSFLSPPREQVHRCENFFLQGYCSLGSRCLFLHDECSWSHVTVSPTTPSDTPSAVISSSFSSPFFSSMQSPPSFTAVTPKGSSGYSSRDEGRSGEITRSNVKSFLSISFSPCSSPLISSPQLVSCTPLLLLSSLRDSPPVLNSSSHFSPSSPFSDASLEKKKAEH